ncbi:hypothetical protein TNIN_398261 [Trichonephila inaurata madagascariensis]|uniref:Uncharacterized protein n=1 Tax=Trichonephila inaurata madagascariensis TaxID=2747483 RepID=A0A8X7BQ25_9ARAC|nr:hypothetical protein TNIN_398261 [Trichonephila inaurata madagascariensis]
MFFGNDNYIVLCVGLECTIETKEFFEPYLTFGRPQTYQKSQKTIYLSDRTEKKNLLLVLLSRSEASSPFLANIGCIYLSRSLAMHQ